MLLYIMPKEGAIGTNKIRMNYSKKFFGLFGLLLVITNVSYAQFLRTSYFMEGSHYR